MVSFVESAGSTLRKLRVKKGFSLVSCALCTAFLFSQGMISRDEASDVIAESCFTTDEYDHMMEIFYASIQDREVVASLASVQVNLR